MTAELVDELRRMLGAERVDAAIQSGVRAQREFRAIEAAQGLDEARRWLRQQTFPLGSFMAVEGDQSVGIMPDRPRQADQAGNNRKAGNARRRF